MISGKPTRELSVNEILSSTFDLYLSNFPRFLLLFLIAGIIVGLSNYVIASSFTLPQPPSPNASEEEMLSWIIDFLSTFIIMMALLFIVLWIVGTVTIGVAVKYASDRIEQKSSSLGASFKFAASKFPSLLIVHLIVAVLMLVGLIAFIIPGIIIAIMFSLVTPVIIVEQRGAFESLGRSKKLVDGRWLKTLGIALVLGIIAVIFSAVISVVTLPLGDIRSIINPSITSALIGPLFPVAITHLYYSMVAREVPSPPPPPPPTF